MKKALKKVAPSSFGACIGVAIAGELRSPNGFQLGSFLLSISVYYLIVLPIVAVLFWLWDSIWNKSKKK